MNAVMDALAEKHVEFVVQEKQLGTAHAASEFLKQYPAIEGLMLVLSGDTPLLQPSTLRDLLKLHEQRQAAISLLTTELAEPTGYGRVIRNDRGCIERIVEEVDATAAEKGVREVNAGVYVFDIAKLSFSEKKSVNWILSSSFSDANHCHMYGYVCHRLSVGFVDSLGRVFWQQLNSYTD